MTDSKNQRFLSLIIIWSLSDEARIGTGMQPWSITSPVRSWKSSRNNNFQKNEEKSIFTSAFVWGKTNCPTLRLKEHLKSSEWPNQAVWWASVCLTKKRMQSLNTLHVNYKLCVCLFVFLLETDMNGSMTGRSLATAINYTICMGLNNYSIKIGAYFKKGICLKRNLKEMFYL